MIPCQHIKRRIIGFIGRGKAFYFYPCFSCLMVGWFSRINKAAHTHSLSLSLSLQVQVIRQYKKLFNCILQHIHDVLSLEQVEDLQTMVSLQRPLLSQMAITLLKMNDPGYEYQEYLSLPPEDPELMSAPGIDVIKDRTKREAMKLYPNPAHDFATIEYLTSDLIYNNLYLVIYDISGKKVFYKDLEGGDNEELIDLSQLKSGIYMVRLFADDNPLDVKQLNITN